MRLQNAKEAAALVSFSISNNINFVMCSGGHDFYDRSEVSDALNVDMKDITMWISSKKIHRQDKWRCFDVGPGYHIVKT